MESQNLCCTCRTPKTPFTCGACNEPICKNCVQHVDSEAFMFLDTIPDNLNKKTYCGTCYTNVVAPELESYNEIVERAKQVYMFFSTHRKPIPLNSKSKEMLKVENCHDRDESILRLGFLAAKMNHNAVVKLIVSSEKIGTGSYMKYKWSATGYPAQINLEIMDRRDKIERLYHMIN